MPFTFSHPAIILPLGNQKLRLFSLSGLIAGSIVPDVEFLFRLRETDCFAHDWPWVFIFNIPVAILLTFVFHLLIRNSFIIHLPKSIRQRFTDLLYFNWKKYFTKNIAKIIFSILIGIASHLLLDALTHKEGRIVLMHPFFRQQWTYNQYYITVYYFLQLLLSLLGAIYIVWVVAKMKKGSDVYLDKKINSIAYWLTLLLVGALLFVFRLYALASYGSTDDLIIAFVGCYVYALILVSVYYHKRIKKAL